MARGYCGSSAPSMREYNGGMNDKQPRIILWCDDLYFTSRIERVAETVGCDVLYSSGDQAPSEFVAQLADNPPALIVLDMNVSLLPWEEWMRALKSDTRTAAIPVIAFGSHKDVDAMKAAKQAGADQVLAKSRFVDEFPRLLSNAL